MGRGGGGRGQGSAQLREADGTKCHRKVKENEEGMSNGVSPHEECFKTSFLS